MWNQHLLISDVLFFSFRKIQTLSKLGKKVYSSLIHFFSFSSFIFSHDCIKCPAKDLSDSMSVPFLQHHFSQWKSSKPTTIPWHGWWWNIQYRYIHLHRVRNNWERANKSQSKTILSDVAEPGFCPSIAGYLQWDIKHSMLSGVNYYNSSWLTVLQPGNYYVYSRVTFSKGDSKSPLANKVKRRMDANKPEEDVMEAFCYLDVKTTNRCSASQGEILKLEAGNQLSVWVQDLSLVNYEEGATSFGMYKL